jgi:TIR domain
VADEENLTFHVSVGLDEAEAAVCDVAATLGITLMEPPWMSTVYEDHEERRLSSPSYLSVTLEKWSDSAVTEINLSATDMDPSARSVDLDLKVFEDAIVSEMTRRSQLRAQPSPSSTTERTESDESATARAPRTVFISYRRTDSRDVTGRIADRLTEHFGHDAVFKDVDSVPLGRDFRTHIAAAVQRCDVLLAVIGPTWLSVQDDDGRRRLTQPNDFVRIEIETALARDIPVVPVLVNEAALPTAESLPKGLKDLAYRQAARVRPDPDFHTDVSRLIQGLDPSAPDPSD